MFRFLRFFAGAAITATLLTVPFMISSAGTSTNTVSVIVEFRDDPGAVYAAKLKRSGALPSSDQIQAYRNNLSATQDQFLNALKSSGINFQLQTIAVKNPAGNVAGNVTLRYSLVYNGMALTVPETAVPTIANMSGVKKVHPNQVLQPDLYKSVPYIRANLLYGNNRNDLGVPPPPPWTPDGNEGQNVVVAVIDTGIDWTHPMFGGDPTPPRLGILPATAGVNTNQKVIYQLPLADVITDGFGHGTHVSSTIAGYLASAPGPDGIPGTADDIPLHGVAPQAKLMSYKVCSDSLSTVGSAGVAVGGCFTSNIVMAIEDAVSPTTVDLQPKPVADVISMSLGGGGGPDEATAVASDNATLLGCSVVAAAGNSGPGEGTLGSPASGRHVIAVAASNDPADGNNTIDVTDGSRTGMNVFPVGGSAPITADITKNYVFCGLGEKPTDFPASVSGNIALIQRGSTVSTPSGLPTSAGTGLFAVKASNAAAAGAVAAVVYNNVDGEITAVTAYKTVIPALGMSKANGEFLMSIIGSDPTSLSAQKIRINKATVFTPSMATFSSRGPVQGSAQVKPDVSAPGVNILAAAPTASTVWALAGSGPMYATISGTSMATPHTSGAVALIRNAHLDWTPDVIRTAMINTATNLRSESQVPQADGLYSILSQGGGLIDVYHAANIKALMGEAGDGITAPSILGSHSYGEVPVANNRVTSTQSVTVTIQDLSGQGGTYNLGVANSQDVAINGIGVTTSPSSVNVPANGSATFTVNTTFDGNLIRDPNLPITIVNGNQVTVSTRPIETQWYVTAQRSDGGESLRMPFYYKPVFAFPATTSTDTTPFSGSIAIGDSDLEAQSGVDFIDFPITVDSSTVKIDAELNYFPVVTSPAVSSNTELDLYLVDPNGNRVAQSLNDGLQRLSFITINQPGTYHLLVDGNVAANTAFTLNATRTHGNALPPAVAPFTGDFVDAQGNQVDFDGNVTINWTPNGGEQGFEIEQTSDDKDSQGNPLPDNQKNWQIVGDVSGSTTSFNVTGLSDGPYFFRVRAIYPGQIGMFVTSGSHSVKVLVSARTKVDITSLVDYPVNFTCCTGGIEQVFVNLTNKSTQTYVPYVDFYIIHLTSTSGTVKVKNADNHNTGLDASSPAQFSFTDQLGSDQLFSPNETTGTRTVEFYNNGEMASWDVLITAYVGTGSSSGSSSSSNQSSSPSSGNSTTGILPLTQIKAVMRFTYNPLTRTITKQLISLK
jgi:minor extracellular serine protease Vpr